MSLFIASLNSGSNGNCYYIGNDSEAVLIDAGISCREIEKRMKKLGLSIRKVKAVFVSHEHTDHISGIPVLAKKYQLPIYITHATLLLSRIKMEKHLVMPFDAEKTITIGSMSITAFQKQHDAVDPYSFTIACNGTNVGVFTDIGKPCEHLIFHFKQCHAAFLEANYDETMLDEGSYPPHLKNRIRGGKGHLSNKQALDIFTSHKPSFMSHLFLSHLSKNNNCPDLVRELFNANAAGVKIVIASRYEETGVYHIQDIQSVDQAKIKTATIAVATSQLSFSFI